MRKLKYLGGGAAPARPGAAARRLPVALRALAAALWMARVRAAGPQRAGAPSAAMRAACPRSRPPTAPTSPSRTGFLHAQDRFFEMDLSRRLAAGELSELFGTVALEQDRKARLFRFRSVARAVLAQASPRAARGAGGLRARRERRPCRAVARGPWEYWLLGQRPAAVAHRGHDPGGLRDVVGSAGERSAARDPAARGQRAPRRARVCRGLEVRAAVPLPAGHRLGCARRPRRPGTRPRDRRRCPAAERARPAQCRGRRRRAGHPAAQRAGGRQQQLGGRRGADARPGRRSSPTTCTSGSACRPSGTTRACTLTGADSST